MQNRRMQHTFERENDRHVVLDAKTGYSMSVSTPTRSLGMVSRVCFASRIGKSLHPIPITNRDLRQYKTELPGLPIDPALQYLEVGAGLGQLAEHLAKHPDNPPDRRPVVIDPANYDAMSRLLEYGLDHWQDLELEQAAQSRLMDLMVRCDVIRDSTRVLLLNMTFEQAYRQFPQLQGGFDVVVELHSASLYPDVQGLDAIDVLGAAQMQYRKYVSLLRQPNGHTNGTIAMMIPSRGAHITTYQAS